MDILALVERIGEAPAALSQPSAYIPPPSLPAELPSKSPPFTTRSASITQIAPPFAGDMIVPPSSGVMMELFANTQPSSVIVGERYARAK